MALSFARNTVSDKSLIKKTQNKTTRQTVKGGNIASLIQTIVSMAEAKLKHHKEDYVLLRDKESLHNYVDDMIANTIGTIDTETDGLNPLIVNLVGVCLHTPGNKGAYIPIGHKSYITNALAGNQLTIEEVKEELMRFQSLRRHKWIMHNSKYDIRVLRHTMGIDLDCYWDTMLAGNCIDENESHRLKDLHLKYCDSKDTESLTFDTLFKGVTFDLIPINTAYLYAAGDAIKTYELYEYQKSILERPDMKGPYNVFKNIEMPVVKVCCDMEDRGVCLDFDIANKLSEKYHKIKEERQEQADKALAMYKDLIDNYKMEHPNHRLSEPLSLTSPTQLAILFYDILKLESPNKKTPRGTGEDILKHFIEEGTVDIYTTYRYDSGFYNAENYYDPTAGLALKSKAKAEKKKIGTSVNRLATLCQAILDMRNVDKLLSTYIDKMPTIVHTDGRIHCSYNQYGAKTGRFSSSDPNMQNIPSHNKEIRTMFKAYSSDDVVEESNNAFSVKKWCEVETVDGWKYVSNLNIGDKLLVSENGDKFEIIITNIVNLVDNNHILIYY